MKRLILAISFISSLAYANADVTVYGNVYAAVGGNYDQLYFRNLGEIKKALTEADLAQLEVGKFTFITGTVKTDHISYQFVEWLNGHSSCHPDQEATVELSFAFMHKEKTVESVNVEVRCSRLDD